MLIRHMCVGVVVLFLMRRRQPGSTRTDPLFPSAPLFLFAGHRLRAWNRSGGSVDGGTMLGAPSEAVDGDAVLTMLSDDAAIRSVILDAEDRKSTRLNSSH